MTTGSKCQLSKRGGGLWARLDDKNLQVLWFDNMQNGPIKGAVDWKKYDINFEVPKDSVTLSFGVLLVGSGNVWINGADISELQDKKKIPVEDLPITLDF